MGVWWLWARHQHGSPLFNVVSLRWYWRYLLWTCSMDTSQIMFLNGLLRAAVASACVWNAMSNVTHGLPLLSFSMRGGPKELGTFHS